MDEVRHVFGQLVHCVEHMHDKGYLHGDIKTLNIIRVGSDWKLIDLDAACEIGIESVGYKYSSAYAPPEAIYISEHTGQACVRGVGGHGSEASNYQLLLAHPSYDIWSLGCVLYQMCTTDVRPLFQGGQDDNLTDDRNEVDNLFALHEWSPELKSKKLARVPGMYIKSHTLNHIHLYLSLYSMIIPCILTPTLPSPPSLPSTPPPPPPPPPPQLLPQQIKWHVTC